MKKRFLFISILMSIIFAGCSNLVHDLGNLGNGSKYTVNHYLQNVEDDEYTLEKTEVLKGKAGEQTKAEMKEFKGFVLAKGFEITQEEIAEDESTVVDIKYDRKTYTIEFDPDGGLWNYEDSKKDSSVEKIGSSVKITGRYGSSVKENAAYPDFAKLGKKGCVFAGWQKEGSDAVIPAEELENNLPEVFDDYAVVSDEGSAIIYKAVWEINGTKYIVRYLTEDLDGNGYSVYREIPLAGEEGDTTEAVAIDIDGFVKPEDSSIIQKTISGDAENPTVVEIKYNRALYSVTIDANEGYWNYFVNKANPGVALSGENKVISVKFGASFALNDYVTADFGKKSKLLSGWYKDGNTTECISTENAVISEMPAKDVEFKASWVDNLVNYKVVYSLENVEDDNYTEDEKRTVTLSGLAETETKVSLEETDDYYEAEEIEGFKKLSFVENVEIAADGSTVILLKYKRARYVVTFDPAGGMWNYSSYKLAPESIVPDTEAKNITVKYGAVINYPEWASLGKKGSELLGWKKAESEQIIATNKLPSNQTEKGSVSYTAVWKEKVSKYHVEYYEQNILDEEYPETASRTVELEGKAGTPTKVSLVSGEGLYTLVDIPGFTKPEKVTNKEIEEDDSTVIKVYYTRNTYTIKFSLDDGLWNYAAYVADPSGVVADTKDKSINVKYGATISYAGFALGDVGKRSYEFAGWLSDSNIKYLNEGTLPQVLNEAKDVTYTAQWIKLSNVKYTVEHWFENADSNDADLNANYTIDARYTENKTGVAEVLTEAAARTIEGFTAKTFVQEEIKRDGSTVVTIYYKRNVVNVKLDLDGGMWNFGAYMANPSGVTANREIKTITGKYGTTVDYSTVPFGDKGRKSSIFLGWAKDGVTYSDSQLIQAFPASDVTYTAKWELTGFEYKVQHYFEKATSTDSNNVNNYEMDASLTETLKGAEGDYTDAAAKTVEGFTAKEITQAVINRNGSVIVKVYYTRNSSKIILKVNGGKWSDSSTADKVFTGKHGSTYTGALPANPTKAGWTFGGWNEYKGTVDKTFTLEDKIYEAYWVSQVTVSSAFVGDMIMTLNTSAGVTTGTVTLPEGYEAEAWSYKWYVDGVFVSDAAVFTRTDAQFGPGKHTVTLKLTENNVTLTAQGTITVARN